MQAGKVPRLSCMERYFIDYYESKEELTITSYDKTNMTYIIYIDKIGINK